MENCPQCKRKVIPLFTSANDHKSSEWYCSACHKSY
jgi:hypothetical protein